MLFLPLLIQEPARLTLDFTQPGIRVSPMLYGHMTEEINYSYDGGLYGELVRNRAFMDNAKTPAHWTAVGGSSQIALEPSGLSEARPTALRVTGGVSNDGYWGIPVRPSTSYRLSVWAKSDDKSPIKASLESEDGQRVFAEATLRNIDGTWRNVTTTL